MTDVLRINHAGMLDGQELLIELSDGRVVEIDIDQVLSLHPTVLNPDTCSADDEIDE